jgi:ribose transport system substrate-binding protein
VSAEWGAVVEQDDHEEEQVKSFRRTGIAAVLAVAVVAVAAATSTAGASKSITVAVMPKFLGVAFYTQTDNGAKCAATKMSGVKVDVTGPSSLSIPKQISDFNDLVTKQVNGIDFAASDAKALQPLAAHAMAKGIKVVNFDSGITPQGKVPLFATDNAHWGKDAADRLAKFLGPAGGDIGLLHFSPGSQTDNERTGGFISELKKYPKVKIVATGVDNVSAVTALSLVSNMLTAHSEIKAIYAPDEEGTVGAAQAVQRAGKVGSVAVFGWDAGPDTIAVLKQGLVNSLVVQNPYRMGYDSLIATVKAIRTGKYGKSEDTGAVIVTKANLSTPSVQAVVNPTCKTYKP